MRCLQPLGCAPGKTVVPIRRRQLLFLRPENIASLGCQAVEGCPRFAPELPTCALCRIVHIAERIRNKDLVAMRTGRSECRRLRIPMLWTIALSTRIERF